MEEIINKLSQAVRNSTAKRNWGVPITIGLSFALVATIGYYTNWFNTESKHARAAMDQVWHFDNAGEYTITSGVTIADGYVTIDPEFKPAFDFDFSPYTNITDLLPWPSLAMTLAAVDADKTVMYSVDEGANWYPFNLVNDIRIKKLAESTGGEGRIFGLGRTAGPNPNDEIGAVVYAYPTLDDLQEISFISFADSYSVDAGIQRTTGGRLYAGVTPKRPSATSIAIHSFSGNLELPLDYVIPGATSVNNFIQVNNRIYATVSKDSGYIGEAMVYYKDNDDESDWILATFSGTASHKAALGIARDAYGFVYVVTDAGYIMKSKTPGGTPGSDVFEKLDNPISSGMNFIYVDDATNNIWVPLTNGKFLRSINGNDFFEVNTGIDLGEAPSVVITDCIKLSGNQTLWSGGFWQGFSPYPYKGVAWFGNAANNQTIVNNTGVSFTNLSGFSDVSPAGVSAGIFYYRLSKDSADGPWYYVDPFTGNWTVSTSLAETNPANFINQYINKFVQQVGSGTLFVQASFYRGYTPVGFSSPILDSVTVQYDKLSPPAPTIVSVDLNHGVAGDQVIITVANMELDGTNTQVYFGTVLAELGSLTGKTIIAVIVPAQPAEDFAGPVDVTVKQTGYADAVRPDGFTYDPPAVSFAARYYSPILPVAGTVTSLTGFSAIAKGYSESFSDPIAGTVEIAIGFFDANTQELGTGDDGIATGAGGDTDANYYVFAAGSDFATKLATLSGASWLPDVAGVKFRIYMFDPDIAVQGLTSNLWVQSITLEYNTGGVPDNDFALYVIDPDKNTQANGVVTYHLLVEYGVGFNGIADLDTDIDHYGKFFGGDISMIEFLNNKRVGNEMSSNPIMNVYISANPTHVDTQIPFTITGTSGDLVHSVNASLKINSIATNTVTLNLVVLLGDPFIKAPEICDGTNTSICDDWLDSFKLSLYPNDATSPDDIRAIRLEGVPSVVITPDPSQTYPAGPTNLAKFTGVATIAKDSLAVFTDGTKFVVYIRSGRHVWTRASAELTYDVAIDEYTVDFNTPVQPGDFDANNRINIGDLIMMANRVVTAPFYSLYDVENNDSVTISDLIVVANRYIYKSDDFYPPK